jgi:hypothetical protein
LKAHFTTGHIVWSIGHQNSCFSNIRTLWIEGLSTKLVGILRNFSYRSPLDHKNEAAGTLWDPYRMAQSIRTSEKFKHEVVPHGKFVVSYVKILSSNLCKIPEYPKSQFADSCFADLP